MDADVLSSCCFLSLPQSSPPPWLPNTVMLFFCSAPQGAWVRDRLVLVGDAAHTAPPDGQGANLALEDAAVLGACVRKHGLGPEVRAHAVCAAARLALQKHVQVPMHRLSVPQALGARNAQSRTHTPLPVHARLEPLTVCLPLTRP